MLLLRRASIVKVGIKLPNVFTLANRGTVEAWAAVRATNVDGFSFDGMKIGPVDAFLGPVIVSNIQFTYNRTAETWSGGADIQLLPTGVTIKAAPPVYGIGIRGGAFDYAGFGAKFEIPPQLFPGIGLREIGGAIGIKPLRFAGRLAISAGGIVSIDSTAFMAFASAEQPFDFPAGMTPPGLGFLAGRKLDSYSIAIGGTASLTVPKLGEFPLVESYVFYAYPDFMEFGGKAEIKVIGDKFKIKGEVGGWADVSQRLFNLEGSVEACLDIEIFDACPSVGAVVSSKGIGFCTIVPGAADAVRAGDPGSRRAWATSGATPTRRTSWSSPATAARIARRGRARPPRRRERARSPSRPARRRPACGSPAAAGRRAWCWPGRAASASRCRRPIRRRRIRTPSRSRSPRRAPPRSS